MAATQKKCNHCGQMLTVDCFQKDKTGKYGVRSICKQCQKEYKKDYWYNRGGKEKRNTAVRKYANDYPVLHSKKLRKRALSLRYGITLEDYDEMFEKQVGVCAICGNIEPSGRRLAVDHNHNTGKVRGLLCINCNRKLGILEDIEFVTKAKQYQKAIDKQLSLTLLRKSKCQNQKKKQSKKSELKKKKHKRF